MNNRGSTTTTTTTDKPILKPALKQAKVEAPVFNSMEEVEVEDIAEVFSFATFVAKQDTRPTSLFKNWTDMAPQKPDVEEVSSKTSSIWEKAGELFGEPQFKGAEELSRQGLMNPHKL